MKKGFTFDDVLLVPKYSEISSRKNVDISTSLVGNFRTQIPIISSCMDTVTEREMAKAMTDLGGAGVVHRFMSIEDQVSQVSILKSPVIAAVGSGKQEIKRIDALKDYVDIFVIDIAHGHSKNAKEVINYIKVVYPNILIIAGSVATYEGARDLITWGADGIRVGVGSGSICTTRIVTGFGVPQLSAISECALARDDCNSKVTIISDGGIRNSGDIVKALAAGADSVMLGSLLAGHSESPGSLVHRSDKVYKVVRGMASRAAFVSKNNGIYVDDYVPEGIEALVPFRGNVRDTITQLIGGIRSGLSYSGAHNLYELRKNTEFIHITNAGMIESNWHDVEKP